MSESAVQNMDRIITTRMSANVVADLMKLGVNVSEMAGALRVREDFIRRVQRRLHSFSFQDIKRLAKLTDLTPQLLLFNAIRPVRSDVKELFDATRHMLEVSASVDSQFRKKTKRRTSRRRVA